MDRFLNKIGLHFLIQKNNTSSNIKKFKSILENQFNDTIPLDKKEAEYLKINLGQFRSPDSFNTQTKKILSVITTGEDISPVGSSKYTIHRYPGDIDMYEEIKSCCSLKEASRDIKKKIQKMATLILKNEDIYMADFKAGVDKRYKIEHLGEIDPYYKLKDYNSEKVTEQITSLYENKYFSKKEFIEVMNLIKQNPSIEEWHVLEEFIRQFYIIRWEVDELIDGFICIRDKVSKSGTQEGQIKIKLEDAIQEKSVCKVDIWAPINGRFIEITNFLVFIYIDEQGKEHIINMNIDNYILNLIKDLKKYGKGGYKQNSLKYAKRLWSISNTLDETKKLEHLFPLFSSGAAILYQINAEIEVLIEMLENIDFSPYTKKQLKKKLKKASKGLKLYIQQYQKDSTNIQDSSPIPMMMDQIENFKSRISLVYEEFNDSEKLFRIVNTIIDFYRSKKKVYLNKKETQIIINNLKEIETIIHNYVEEYTSNYLKKNNLDNVHQYDSIIPFL